MDTYTNIDTDTNKDMGIETYADKQYIGNGCASTIYFAI